MSRAAIGLLYLVTGLLVGLVYTNFTGAMLGMTTPIFTVSGLLTLPLFLIGPSLLFLCGTTALGRRTSLGRQSLIAGITLVVALAALTIPRIGWRYATFLILEPATISLFLAWLVLLLVKKRWVSAAIGSGLSSPYSLFGGSFVLYQNLSGTSPFSVRELVLIVPGTFVLLSFLAALFFRSE